MDKTALLGKLSRHPARLEPLLAELIESKQVTLESIVFRPRSLFSRAYSNDVTGVDVAAPKTDKKKDKETLFIDVCREGFYDALPEFLFHGPEEVSGYKNIEQRLKESEKVRQEEVEARQFFSPFEQEFFRRRLEFEFEERRLLSGFANPLHHTVFDYFWKEIKDTDEQSKSVLFYLFPLAYKISGNRTLMAFCFTSVLRDAVRFANLSYGTSSFEDFEIARLGECELGVNMVTSGVLEEDLPDLGVYIGPIDLSALPEYLEEGRKHNLLRLLYSYFVPAEMDIQTHILLKQPENGFILNEDQATARLGFSTYLA